MEEGEIVDDGLISDVDSGQLGHPYMRGNGAVENALVDHGKSSKISNSPKSDRSGDSKSHRSNGSRVESPNSVSIVNVDSRRSSKSGSSRYHRERDGRDYENGKAYNDLDMEKNSYVRTDRRHDCDKRRERSSSRHRSNKHKNGESLDKNKERTNRDWKDERDRRGTYNGRKKEFDSDSDRENRRGRDRGLSRDRDYERKRRRDASISSYRARDSYNGGDRHDDEARRSKRKYDDQDNGHGGRDRHSGYKEPEYMEDRNRKYDTEKSRKSKDVSVEDANRDNDDDQSGYEERVEVILAAQEDDVDRIMEESRRRTEAILQKYKAKQLQQPVVPPDAEQSQQQVVPLKNEAAALISTNADVRLGGGYLKSERSNNMFGDNIFGDSPAGSRKMGEENGLLIEGSGQHDNWDDAEGYYCYRVGEILDNRYEITAAHGKGVFSKVVRAKDLKAGSCDPKEVAIKIIRNNETMLKAGLEEVMILKRLVDSDPEDKRHCVRYLSHFKYRNHLCIVFESLNMNLREVLKKFGRNIGLKVTAVRLYAKQLFIALKHLRSCGVLHCDIKPDNMLVNDAKNVLKLCDLGNAMLAGKNEITPYLVSRFYRAPEIILGLAYDHPMDIWSVGCCLYELYTGKVLFPGATNNDMLRLHMELKGSFPKKMLRKGAFVEPHFNQDLNFLSTEEDPVTKMAIRRLICNIKPKGISAIIKSSLDEDSKMIVNFKDLLDKMFVLDPDKRLTVSQALDHPFITGK